jgi:hypothetical protein
MALWGGPGSPNLPCFFWVFSSDECPLWSPPHPGCWKWACQAPGKYNFQIHKKLSFSIKSTPIRTYVKWQFQL